MCLFEPHLPKTPEITSMTTQALAAPRLESTPCARCRSTGNRGGFACLTCEGSGAVLTKRGLAARDYMRRQLVKPAHEVVVGDVIHFTVGNLKIASRVNRVEVITGQPPRVRLHGVRKKTGDDIVASLAVGCLVSLAHTVDELVKVRADVEAYQAALTKTGDVRRNRLIAQAA